MRGALAHRSARVVARAAGIAREADLSALGGDLAAVFPRFLEDPVRRDPGCLAKLALVETLLAFEHWAPDVYLAGARHVQKEPAYGGPVDTAAALRGASAEGLVAMRHPDALARCVDLLVDREPAARLGALRALGASGRPDVALAVRLLLLRGDPAPEVTAGAFAVLLGLAPEDSVPFVAERLAADSEDVARAAAFALGETRRDEAVGALRERLVAERRADVRHAVMVALATSRQDAAFDLLLDAVARGGAADSRAAVDALRIYAHDDALQERVRQALAARAQPRSASMAPRASRAARRQL